MALNTFRVGAMLMVAASSSASAFANDAVLEVQQQGNIAYVSGGIGTMERDALQAVQGDYNLRIMNTDASGHFAGDTRIVISDTQNNALLDATGGPLFYANLPKGRYIVEGYSQQHTKKQVVTITQSKPARIRFIWPEDVRDTPSY